MCLNYVFIQVWIEDFDNRILNTVWVIGKENPIKITESKWKLQLKLTEMEPELSKIGIDKWRPEKIDDAKFNTTADSTRVV